jgi:hypothetical protein
MSVDQKPASLPLLAKPAKRSGASSEGLSPTTRAAVARVAERLAAEVWGGRWRFEP